MSDAPAPAPATPYGSDFGDDGEAQLADLLDEAQLLQGQDPLGLSDLEDVDAIPGLEVVEGSTGSTGSTGHAPGLAPLHAVPRLVGDVKLEARRVLGRIEREHRAPGGTGSFAGGIGEGATTGTAAVAATAATTSNQPSARDELDSPSPAGTQQQQQRQKEDTRSPLERFRTQPKKPLSVTDLVSPAWCELQYWFNLTRYGRVRKTAAMKRGTKVHKVLEEQVYETVQIDVQTKEDNWGLKLWNVIQGLRTLRTTGMTRELEIYGTVDGLVITGIIDELSYTSTNPELEAKLSQSKADQNESPPDQVSIRDFFKKQTQGTAPPTPSSAASDMRARKVYLSDVKTRNHKSLPSGASLVPTEMQLMLYRRLLSRLANNEMDAEIIFDRFKLDSAARFSDALIAQLSQLDLNLSTHADQTTSINPIESHDDAMAELLAHNNLSKLWSLMIQEYQLALPRGPESISRILQAEYRGSRDGQVIGRRTFLYNHDRIEGYISSELDWWRGIRPAKGVDIEDAFKCNICEFAEGCEWRLGKVEETTQRSRARGAARESLAG